MFGLEIAGAVQPWVALGILIVMFTTSLPLTLKLNVSLLAAGPLAGEDARVLLGRAKELGCNFVRLAHYPYDEHMTRMALQPPVLR